MKRGQILILLLLVSCAAGVIPPSLPMVKLDISPGQVEILKVPLPEGAKPERLICRGEEVPFYIDGSAALSILAESYFSKSKGYKCTLHFDGKSFDVATISIKKKSYPRERLNVDKKRVILSPEDLKKVIAEREIKKEVYRSSSAMPLFTKPFMAPLDSKITSIYGTKRVFNNAKKTQHLGIDYRAGIGVPIPVTNDGQVVYAGEFFFSGNVVIIDHGLNIYSMYGHLSELKTQTGDMVKRGDVIGLAGMTGRVTGPHLHWGVRINKMWIDGHSLVEKSAKYYGN